MSKQQRDKIVQQIFTSQPDMKVIYLNLVNNGNWPQEKTISELSQEEKEQFNLRKQFPNELILDIEEKYMIEEIKRKLQDKKWTYTMWNTGSRGYHISVTFQNLSSQPVELRDRIRRFYIEQFETDLKLAKQSQWLALEWTPHFKTGNVKTLLDAVNEGTNTVPADVIEYCKRAIIKRQQVTKETSELLTDFHTKDPYLKYAMENVIESGNRNNILFKNLGIGLAKSGLSREQILPYAQKIVANCPGKNVGEFMGWVDKTQQGHLKDYNRTEMLQWGLEHGMEPLYKLYDDEELIDLMSIKQLYDELWNHKIECQDIWKDLCFYNLIGTILDEKEEDLRTHVIFSSYSSTGKDEGLNFIRDLLDSLGYKTRTPATITDRTLVGAVNQTKLEYNIKNDLSEDKQEKGSKSWKDPVEKGFLQDTNWMAFGEAEFIFRPGAHNRHIQLILRQAMDKSRKIEKGVGGFDIPVRTNTSLILVTYTMSNIINSVLHNGLFQRALFYNKSLTTEEHKIIRNFINKSRFNDTFKEQFNKKKYTSKLLEKLRTMKKWYDENKKKFKYAPNSDKLVEAMWEKVEKNYEGYFKGDKDILDSMVRRSANNLFKLVTLNATWNMTHDVSHAMIKENFGLIIDCIDSIKEMVVNQDKAKKVKYAILNYVSKESVSRMNIHYELETNLKMRRANDRSKFIQQLIDAEYISEYKNGRKNMLVITSKGREYLTFEED